MVKLSNHKTITTTGSAQLLLKIPSDSIAELKQLIISNGASATATVELRSGDGSDSDYDYTILKIKVDAGKSINLNEKDLEGFRAIKNIYVVTDQQPIDVSIVVDAK